MQKRQILLAVTFMTTALTTQAVLADTAYVNPTPKAGKVLHAGPAAPKEETIANSETDAQKLSELKPAAGGTTKTSEEPAYVNPTPKAGKGLRAGPAN